MENINQNSPSPNDTLCALCSSHQTVVAAHLEHLLSEHFEIVSMAVHRMESVCQKSERESQNQDRSIIYGSSGERARESGKRQSLDSTNTTHEGTSTFKESSAKSDTEECTDESNVLVIEPRDDLDSTEAPPVPLQSFSASFSVEADNKKIKGIHKSPTVKSKPLGTRSNANHEKGGIYIVTIGNKRNIVVPGSEEKKRGQEIMSGDAKRVRKNNLPLVATRTVPSESWQYTAKPIRYPKRQCNKTQSIPDGNSKKEVTEGISPQCQRKNKSSQEECSDKDMDSLEIKLETEETPTAAYRTEDTTSLPGPSNIHIKEEKNVRVNLEVKSSPFDLVKEIDELVKESAELVSVIKASLCMTNWKAYSQKLSPFSEILFSIQTKIHGIETVLYKEGTHSPLKLYVLEKGQLHFQTLAHYTPVTVSCPSYGPTITLTSLCGAVAANFMDPSLLPNTVYVDGFISLLKGLTADTLLTHHDLFMSLIYRDHTPAEAQQVFTCLLGADPSLLQPSQTDFLLLALSIVLQRDVYLYVLVRDLDELLPPTLTAQGLLAKYTEQHPALRHHVLYAAPLLLQRPGYGRHGACRLLYKQAGRKYWALLRKSHTAIDFVPFTKPFSW